MRGQSGLIQVRPHFWSRRGGWLRQPSSARVQQAVIYNADLSENQGGILKVQPKVSPKPGTYQPECAPETQSQLTGMLMARAKPALWACTAVPDDRGSAAMASRQWLRTWPINQGFE